MRGDGQVINPADNGTNSARRPRTTDRKAREEEQRGMKGSGSKACRSPSLLAGLLEENRQSDDGWNVDAKPASWSNTRVC
jgi:hypothetical protein